MPTDQEIRRAKDYILLRLRAERLSVSILDDALLSAARRIISISRRYNIPPELFRFSDYPALRAQVNAVLATLRGAVFENIREIDTFTDEDGGKYVAPAVTEPFKEKTFRERLAQYVSRWGFELEATIAGAGISGVKDENEILRGVREYLDRPYQNPWIKDNQDKGDARRLDGHLPHYGMGNPIASHKALSVLVTTTVATGWMQNWKRINADKRGYYVFRGSSFPCEICDFQASFPHDISDTAGMPPFHPNCRCYVVFTDEL